MGDFSKDCFCAEWKDSIFKNYAKMNTSGAKVLRVQPAFKVKLQNTPNYYKLYTCTVANGSSQIQGIDFDVSYSPTSAFDNIRMVIAIAAAENMIIYSLDVSNAFQTNIKEKPYERVYISILPFYLEYFFGKWPNHPLLRTPVNELCLQGLKSIQGTKPEGHKWNIMLSCILVNDLKMI
eukprot:826083-Ditylum_brightwellii.AAC.2